MSRVPAFHLMHVSELVLSLWWGVLQHLPLSSAQRVERVGGLFWPEGSWIASNRVDPWNFCHHTQPCLLTSVSGRHNNASSLNDAED